jgi:hypothetical protein
LIYAIFFMCYQLFDPLVFICLFCYLQESSLSTMFAFPLDREVVYGEVISDKKISNTYV